VEAVHEGFQELHAVCRGGSLHFEALHRVHRQRLLAKDVLPLLSCLDGPLLVQPVGKGVVDCFDSFIVEEIFVTPVEGWDGSLLSEFPGSPLLSGSDCEKLSIGGGLDRWIDGPSPDIGRADHAPA
jgi:hypothetical protein